MADAIKRTDLQFTRLTPVCLFGRYCATSDHPAPHLRQMSPPFFKEIKIADAAIPAVPA